LADLILQGEVIKMKGYCPDPILITEPKTFAIQSISILFDLRDSCRFLRLPDLLQSLAAEIFLPTDARARYLDNIWTLSGEGDNC